MFHLLILAIIETLYIDIQIFVYLNDGKTIIFGKASFYHSFHCKIVDSMPKTIVPGTMVPLDNGYYLTARAIPSARPGQTLSSNRNYRNHNRNHPRCNFRRAR